MEDSTIDVVYGHVTHLPHSTLKQARWKTMSGIELSGYIEVKVPNRERRFGSWKAWKKQWCMIGESGNKATLQLGADKYNITACIQIPEDALLCRTESRSRSYAFGIFYPNMRHKQACIFLSGESETETQKWISNIRNVLKPPLNRCGENEFEISLIDNEHSRAAGLHGLYGRLSVTCSEILIKDAHNGKIKVTWHWSQINHSYLPLPANSEDVQRVCTICTSSKFKAGEGELEVFCMQAGQLHERLSACPRLPNKLPRIVTTPLPPTPDDSPPPTPPRSRVYTSPSTGLMPHPQTLMNSRRMSRSENDIHKFFIQRSLNNLNSVASQELLLLSSDNITVPKVPNLLLTNIGFLISTPGCSEPESLNEVHTFDNRHVTDEKVEYQIIDEETNEIAQVNAKRNLSFVQRSLSHHQLFRVVKRYSGDYEEISFRDFDNRDSVDAPPPLPPRKSDSRSNLRNSSLNALEDTKLERANSDLYLPMEPVGSAEQKYVVMSNLKDKVFVTKPVPI